MAITYKTTVTQLAPADSRPVVKQNDTTAPDPVVPSGNGWRLVNVSAGDNAVYYTWVQGSSVVTVNTTPYNISETDEIVLVDASNDNVTNNLPSPIEGTQITVKKIDSSSNVVTIDGNGNTIDGDSTQTISTQYTALKVASDGTNWFIV